MWFNVFINMTTMSNTPSSNDNQRVIVVKEGRAAISEIMLHGQDCVDKLRHQKAFSN